LRTSELIVSELVANAARHGSGCLALTASCHEGHITLAAVDGSEALPERRNPYTVAGRGLIMIDEFSASWGVDTYNGGNVFGCV